MAYEKLTKILELARALASTAEGLTLDEMCREIRCERRTVERMRDAIREVFPQLEEITDHPTKRFRIPGGLDGFFQDPSVEELSDLGVAIAQLRRSGAVGRAESLAGLDRKIRAAMRLRGRRAAEVDVEALLRAELIAVRAGPRPQENPEVMTELRKALLGMKLLRFTYRGGTKPGASRRVVPYGIIFGRMNYLIGADAGTVKPKNWRLDRIDKVKCLETPATRPENFDLAAFANRSFGFFEGPQEEVALRIHSQGMDDFRNYCFHPNQTIEDCPDGSAIVRFRASGMPELACHLFVWADKIEIVEPISLRELLLTQLCAALKHHKTKISKAG